LLAAYLAVRHFRFLLEGRDFFIETDHKPLTFALHRVSEPWSARQQRQLGFLAEFTADIRHVSGKRNVVADALSRPPASSSGGPGVAVCKSGNVKAPPGSLPAAAAAGSPTADSVSSGPGSAARKPGTVKAPSGSVPAVAAAGPYIPPPPRDGTPPPPPRLGGPLNMRLMARDQELCEQVQATVTSSCLRVRPLQLGDATILCDITGGRARPVVPKSHQRDVFTALHGIAHPGILATKRLISTRFVWKGMAKDITGWCRDCQQCARSKVITHGQSAVQPIQVPSRRFSHLHVDLVGPLPTARSGHTHLLTVIDRTTRWVEAIPLSDTSTAGIAEALFTGWVARFGVPSTISSDRGPQFTSSVWTAMCKLLGIQHQMTTAYHPQANGMIERFHRQLKDSLRARLCGQDWMTHLPWVLLGLRAAPKEDTAVSSAEMLYGLPLTLPGQFLEAIEPPASEFLQKLQDTVVTQSFPTRPVPACRSSDSLPKGLMEATYVYLRRDGNKPPLAQLYQGPYAVIKRGPKVFTLQVGRQTEVVSVDRLKPHLGRGPVEAAMPVKRGRPPASAGGGKEDDPSTVAPVDGGWTAVTYRGRRGN
jgi:transposase InsO family protein